MLRLTEIAQKHLNEANGDYNKGIRDFSRSMESAMKDPKFRTSDVSIKELFTLTVMKDPRNDGIDWGKTSRVAEAVSGSVFPYLTGELINKMMIPDYNEGLADATSLVTESTTTQSKYDYLAGINAMPDLKKVEPGQRYPESGVSEKNVRIEIGKFGRILGLEMELIMSDQTGEVQRRAAGIGKVMGQHLHQLIVETITGQARDALGEATSTALYLNGTSYAASYIFSNDHSAIDDQTNDNLAATSAIDDWTGWQTAWNLISTQKDTSGKYIGITPKVVLVHPFNLPRASQFVNDTNNVPNNANFGSNYFAGAGLKIFSSPYTSDTNTDWFLGDPKTETVLLWYKRPTVDYQGTNSDAAFENDIIARFKPNYSAGVGKLDYRYVVKCTK